MFNMHIKFNRYKKGCHSVEAQKHNSLVIVNCLSWEEFLVFGSPLEIHLAKLTLFLTVLTHHVTLELCFGRLCSLSEMHLVICAKPVLTHLTRFT